MSDDVIIRVENLGKCYRIRHQPAERYTALRDVIARGVTAPLRALKGKLASRRQQTGNGLSSEISDSSFSLSTSTEDFWALRHINFEVKRGEALGIIGRNGAGKTTLLKILSRITEPTEGRVRVRGRVASLLEVGTGFHPELTGRENIFLNGAILGMSRAEIREKFDEIIDFAEIEKFLDTPVKRYSSGMYVRLAFAVAAHLEPEILVVDEVLAVGDAEFQKKCLGKMHDVSTKEGRTVLFVSHNLAAILNLCTKGLLLDHGKIILFGSINEVCEAYSRAKKAAGTTRRTTGIFRSLALIDENGIELNTVSEGHPLRFRCLIRAPEERCLLSLVVKDLHNSPLCELFDGSFSIPRRDSSDTSVLVDPRQFTLRPGHYSVDCWCGDRFSKSLEWFHNALEFEVIDSYKSERGTKLLGPFWVPCTWRIGPDVNELTPAGK